MKNRPALTVDNATSASNAARAPISRLRYAWFFPVWPLAWAAALLVTAGLGGPAQLSLAFSFAI